MMVNWASYLRSRPTLPADVDPVVKARVDHYVDQVGHDWARLRAEVENLQRPRAPVDALVRAVVLILVVVAIVCVPLVAMANGTPPEAVLQYVSPITGIGGVIIGYFFGQGTDHPVPAPRSGFGGSDEGPVNPR